MNNPGSDNYDPGLFSSQNTNTSQVLSIPQGLPLLPPQHSQSLHNQSNMSLFPSFIPNSTPSPGPPVDSGFVRLQQDYMTLQSEFQRLSTSQNQLIMLLFQREQRIQQLEDQQRGERDSFTGGTMSFNVNANNNTNNIPFNNNTSTSTQNTPTPQQSTTNLTNDINQTPNNSTNNNNNSNNNTNSQFTPTVKPFYPSNLSQNGPNTNPNINTNSNTSNNTSTQSYPINSQYNNQNGTNNGTTIQNGSNTTVQNSLDELEKLIQHLRHQTSQHSHEFKITRTNMNDIRSQFELIQEKLTTCTSTTQDIVDDINELDSKVINIENEIGIVNTKLDGHVQNVLKIDTKLESMKVEHAKLPSSLQSAQAHITNIQTTLQNQQNVLLQHQTLLDNRNDLDTTLATMHTQQEKILEQQAKHRKEFTQINTQHVEMNKTCTEITKNFKEFSTFSDSNTKQHQDIIKMIEQLKEEHTTQYTTLIEENSNLKTKLSSLEIEIQRTNTKQKTQHTTTQERLDQLISGVKKDRETYKLDSKTINDEINNTTESLTIISNNLQSIERAISQVTSVLTHDQSKILGLLRREHEKNKKKLHDHLSSITYEELSHLFTSGQIVITQQHFREYLDNMWFICDPNQPQNTPPTTNTTNNNTPTGDLGPFGPNCRIIAALYRSPRFKMLCLSPLYWKSPFLSTLTPIEYYIFLLHIHYNVLFEDSTAPLLELLFSRIGIPYILNVDSKPTNSYFYLSYQHTNTKTAYTQHSFNDLIELILIQQPILPLLQHFKKGHEPDLIQLTKVLELCPDDVGFGQFYRVDENGENDENDAKSSLDGSGNELEHIDDMKVNENDIIINEDDNNDDDNNNNNNNSKTIRQRTNTKDDVSDRIEEILREGRPYSTDLTTNITNEVKNNENEQTKQKDEDDVKISDEHNKITEIVGIDDVYILKMDTDVLQKDKINESTTPTTPPKSTTITSTHQSPTKTNTTTSIVDPSAYKQVFTQATKAIDCCSYISTPFFSSLIGVFRFITVLSRSYCTRQGLTSNFPSILETFITQMTQKPSLLHVTITDLYYLTLFWATLLYQDSFKQFSRQHPVCNSVFDCLDELDPNIIDVFTFINEPFYILLTQSAIDWDVYSLQFIHVLNNINFAYEKMSQQKKNFLLSGMVKVNSGTVSFSTPLQHRLGISSKTNSNNNTQQQQFLPHGATSQNTNQGDNGQIGIKNDKNDKIGKMNNKNDIDGNGHNGTQIGQTGMKDLFNIHQQISQFYSRTGGHNGDKYDINDKNIHFEQNNGHYSNGTLVNAQHTTDMNPNDIMRLKNTILSQLSQLTQPTIDYLQSLSTTQLEEFGIEVIEDDNNVQVDSHEQKDEDNTTTTSTAITTTTTENESNESTTQSTTNEPISTESTTIESTTQSTTTTESSSTTTEPTQTNSISHDDALSTGAYAKLVNSSHSHSNNGQDESIGVKMEQNENGDQNSSNDEKNDQHDKIIKDGDNKDDIKNDKTNSNLITRVYNQIRQNKLDAINNNNTTTPSTTTPSTSTPSPSTELITTSPQQSSQQSSPQSSQFNPNATFDVNTIFQLFGDINEISDPQELIIIHQLLSAITLSKSFTTLANKYNPRLNKNINHHDKIVMLEQCIPSLVMSSNTSSISASNNMNKTMLDEKNSSVTNLALLQQFNTNDSNGSKQPSNGINISSSPSNPMIFTPINPQSTSSTSTTTTNQTNNPSSTSLPADTMASHLNQVQLQQSRLAALHQKVHSQSKTTTSSNQSIDKTNGQGSTNATTNTLVLDANTTVKGNNSTTNSSINNNTTNTTGKNNTTNSKTTPQTPSQQKSTGNTTSTNTANNTTNNNNNPNNINPSLRPLPQHELAALQQLLQLPANFGQNNGQNGAATNNNTQQQIPNNINTVLNSINNNPMSGTYASFLQFLDSTSNNGSSPLFSSTNNTKNTTSKLRSLLDSDNDDEFIFDPQQLQQFNQQQLLLQQQHQQQNGTNTIFSSPLSMLNGLPTTSQQQQQQQLLQLEQNNTTTTTNNNQQSQINTTNNTSTANSNTTTTPNSLLNTYPFQNGTSSSIPTPEQVNHFQTYLDQSNLPTQYKSFLVQQFMLGALPPHRNNNNNNTNNNMNNNMNKITTNINFDSSLNHNGNNNHTTNNYDYNNTNWVTPAQMLLNAAQFENHYLNGHHTNNNTGTKNNINQQHHIQMGNKMNTTSSSQTNSTTKTTQQSSTTTSTPHPSTNHGPVTVKEPVTAPKTNNNNNNNNKNNNNNNNNSKKKKGKR